MQTSWLPEARTPSNKEANKESLSDDVYVRTQPFIYSIWNCCGLSSLLIIANIFVEKNKFLLYNILFKVNKYHTSDNGFKVHIEYDAGSRSIMHTSLKHKIRLTWSECLSLILYTVNSANEVIHSSELFLFWFKLISILIENWFFFLHNFT